ncbi:MAG: exodeoxyribonuclease alpha subunit [Frankiales bacterium]|nr:exodeoxyribonuclease alpha subunit [Frankiales bacterium]
MRADRLVGAFRKAAPTYAVVELLVAAELPARLAGGVVSSIGETAPTVLASDPWRLLDADAATPQQADALARQLEPEVTRDDPRRMRALVAHLLTRAAREGHTAVPLDAISRALQAFHVSDAGAAVSAACDAGRVMLFEEGETAELALTRYAIAEDSLAEGLSRLVATAQPLCSPKDVEKVIGGLDPEQADAVRAIAAHGVALLTGGPGTGKSRTVAAVVALANKHDVNVALAAPTGRAAKRLEELTEEPATTLHRLLQAQGTDGTFARGEMWPLDAELVVVDEASMLDVELAAALVEACDDGTHLLIVGDPAQLPSIGPGRVLADLIDSGLAPVSELVTLHRQEEGGAIAQLATRVRQGELPPVDDPTREVVVVTARASAEAAHRVVQLVTDSIPRALGIPAAEVQVVTPVHRGPAGTVELNKVLKARLNPGQGTRNGFDVGDRVVATANQHEIGFANGEVGVVVDIKDGLVVAFPGGEVTVTGEAVFDLRHGWAITVHRAQGSEWPGVVVVLAPEATTMLSRPLVYTAFTRAQRHLSIVHAVGPALARAVHDVDARPRRTRLKALLA